MADIATEARHIADRGTARRRAFLEAARAVFLDHGYEATSVNDIVRKAGGSLATLYGQFGNKEGLFLAVVEDQHERVMAAMAPQSVDNMSLENGLQVLGEGFLRALLLRESLAFFRLVVAEGRKFPESSQAYILAGADKVREVIGAHIRRAAPNFVGDRIEASAFFLELVRSRHHYHAVADDAYVLDEQELSDHVASCVRFFVRALRN